MVLTGLSNEHSSRSGGVPEFVSSMHHDAVEERGGRLSISLSVCPSNLLKDFLQLRVYDECVYKFRYTDFEL